MVVKDPLLQHKRRLCVNYSQTINQYTELDGYPLPRIDDMIKILANYKVFSTFELKSTYHLEPIMQSNLKCTEFVAKGKLYHFHRILFIVTNSVAIFQRAMDKTVEEDDSTTPLPIWTT